MSDPEDVDDLLAELEALERAGAESDVSSEDDPLGLGGLGDLGGEWTPPHSPLSPLAAPKLPESPASVDSTRPRSTSHRRAGENLGTPPSEDPAAGEILGTSPPEDPEDPASDQLIHYLCVTFNKHAAIKVGNLESIDADSRRAYMDAFFVCMCTGSVTCAQLLIEPKDDVERRVTRAVPGIDASAMYTTISRFVESVQAYRDAIFTDSDDPDMLVKSVKQKESSGMIKTRVEQVLSGLPFPSTTMVNSISSTLTKKGIVSRIKADWHMELYVMLLKSRMCLKIDQSLVPLRFIETPEYPFGWNATSLATVLNGNQAWKATIQKSIKGVSASTRPDQFELTLQSFQDQTRARYLKEVMKQLSKQAVTDRLSVRCHYVVTCGSKKKHPTYRSYTVLQLDGNGDTICKAYMKRVMELHKREQTRIRDHASVMLQSVQPWNISCEHKLFATFAQGAAPSKPQYYYVIQLCASRGTISKQPSFWANHKPRYYQHYTVQKIWKWLKTNANVAEASRATTGKDRRLVNDPGFFFSETVVPVATAATAPPSRISPKLITVKNSRQIRFISSVPSGTNLSKHIRNYVEECSVWNRNVIVILSLTRLEQKWIDAYDEIRLSALNHISSYTYYLDDTAGPIIIRAAAAAALEGRRRRAKAADAAAPKDRRAAAAAAPKDRRAAADVAAEAALRSPGDADESSSDSYDNPYEGAYEEEDEDEEDDAGAKAVAAAAPPEAASQRSKAAAPPDDAKAVAAAAAKAAAIVKQLQDQYDNSLIGPDFVPSGGGRAKSAPDSRSRPPAPKKKKKAAFATPISARSRTPTAPKPQKQYNAFAKQAMVRALTKLMEWDMRQPREDRGYVAKQKVAKRILEDNSLDIPGFTSEEFEAYADENYMDVHELILFYELSDLEYMFKFTLRRCAQHVDPKDLEAGRKRAEKQVKTLSARLDPTDIQKKKLDENRVQLLKSNALLVIFNSLNTSCDMADRYRFAWEFLAGNKGILQHVHNCLGYIIEHLEANAGRLFTRMRAAQNKLIDTTMKVFLEPINKKIKKFTKLSKTAETLLEKIRVLDGYVKECRDMYKHVRKKRRNDRYLLIAAAAQGSLVQELDVYDVKVDLDFKFTETAIRVWGEGVVETTLELPSLCTTLIALRDTVKTYVDTAVTASKAAEDLDLSVFSGTDVNARAAKRTALTACRRSSGELKLAKQKASRAMNTLEQTIDSSQGAAEQLETEELASLESAQVGFTDMMTKRAELHATCIIKGFGSDDYRDQYVSHVQLLKGMLGMESSGLPLDTLYGMLVPRI